MRGITATRHLASALMAIAASMSFDGAAARADGISGSPSDTNWTGFYSGAQLGGAWSALDWQFQNANYFNTNGPVVVGNDFDHHPKGVIGGILGGYTYQTGPWVLGLELTASAANMSEELPSPLFPKLDVTTNRVNWLATATGRLGYAWDRWLAFAKGGWAGANVKVTLSDAIDAVYASETQWANGWTVGGGAEYMICDGISLGVAYDYADINVDTKTVTCPACGTGVGFGTPVVDGDVKVQSVMGRLIFHD